MHLPIVTLSTKDNVNVAKKLSDRFKRSVFWNSYQTIPAKVIEKGNSIYELLSASFQGVKRLFVTAYFIGAGANADNESGIKVIKYIFFQDERLKIITYWLMEEIFMSNLLTYDKVTKVSIAQGDDYTKGCLLDYAYFKDNCRVIAVDFSKQKALDADSRAIQEKVFKGIAVGGKDCTKIRLFTILEKSKETALEFCKGTIKVL